MATPLIAPGLSGVPFVDIDINSPPRLGSAIARMERFKLELAVSQMSMHLEAAYTEAASGVELSYAGSNFNVQRVTGDYARGVTRVYPLYGDKLRATVGNISAHARFVEEGHRPFDMKPHLLASPRAKWGISKSGPREGRYFRYITIPMMHSTPGERGADRTGVKGPTMPQGIYDVAKNFRFSSVVATEGPANLRTNRGPGGELVGRRYEWGDRLSESGETTLTHVFNDVEGRQQSYTHKAGLHTGMVRMGQEGHATYMTFRRVSTFSHPNSWWSPELEPRPVHKAVAEMEAPTLTEIFNRITGG